MAERPVCELANGVLRDNREDDVPKLREEHHQDTPHAISHDQHDWNDRETKKRAAYFGARVLVEASQVIDRVFVGDRYGQRDHLRQYERNKRQNHADMQVATTFLPNVGQQLLQHGYLAGPSCKQGIAGRLRQSIAHKKCFSSSALLRQAVALVGPRLKWL